MSSPTVLHLETGRHLYGGALQVFYLLRALQGKGRHILACPSGSALAQAASTAGLEVRPLTKAGDLRPQLTWELRQLLRETGADFLHIHSRRGADSWGVLAARSNGTPYIVTRRVDNPEAPWIGRLKYRSAAATVAISRRVREELLRAGARPERTHLIPSAVDTEAYRPGGDPDWFRQEFGLGPGPLLGMAAQFIARKGYDLLLDTLPAVFDKVPDLQVVLFGQGPLREHLEWHIQSNLRGRKIVFAGFREDLERCLPCLDLLVHPARMEGLGVILLQAAACGLPVVATRAGGIPDIVEEGATGLLVPVNDRQALAAALLKLLQNPEERHRLGRAARKRAEAAFSIPVMAQRYEKLYADLLG